MENVASVAPIKHITLYIPGNKGGAYDHTAKVIKEVLEPKYVENVAFNYVIGAGGALALGQFSLDNRTNTLPILLGGRSMIGAAAYNNSHLSILKTTPLAKLISKPLAIAVPIKSPLKDIDDLLNLLTLDASKVNWIGGSAGAIDYQFLQLMFLNMKLGIASLNYQPVPGGGNSVAQKLADGRYTAGVSTLDEFKSAQQQQLIRVLTTTDNDDYANASDQSPIPTAFIDWHGLFVAKQITAEKLVQLNQLITTLTNDDRWQELVDHHSWKSSYLVGDAFYQFVVEEEKKIINFVQLTKQSNNQQPSEQHITELIQKPYRASIFIGTLCILLVVFILVTKFNATEREKQLNNNLLRAKKEKQAIQKELEEKLTGVSDYIQKEFDQWQLTKTEKEIGLLLLKGLSFKEIAELRNKSERTVRQQAGAIYAKSNLANRNDLSAYFLEDLL